MISDVASLPFFHRSYPAGLLADEPPGTACAAVQAVEGADFVLLVAEPTPFGLHDLHLAVGMLRSLGRRHGVVVNRADEGTPSLRHYCATEGLDILMEIPDDRRIATACSRGEMMIDELPEYVPAFLELLEQVKGKLDAESRLGA